MRVKDIMSREMKTCRLDDTIDKIAKEMVKYDVSMFVVVSNKSRGLIPLGVITKGDIASKVVGEGRVPEEMRVRDVFCAPVRTVYAMDTIEFLSEKLHARNLRNLVVLDEDDNIVGVCGTSDILKVAGGREIDTIMI